MQALPQSGSDNPPSVLFCHSQVVAKLVRVKDPATATALEVAAGGKLYQVRGHEAKGSGELHWQLELAMITSSKQQQQCLLCLIMP